MVKKFCSFEAQKQNIKEGYEYYFIKRGGSDIGYTAIKSDGDRLFLSKLYLLKSERGKKYASAVTRLLKDIAGGRGLRAIWLTVNKHNDSTIAAYNAMGYKTIGEGVADIGNGFVMDDYYMELEV
ncbi:MAG: GNAT family N-acetyltransferase [Oscillospiraceae bacterium]|nr:GNAT family N-acetyltransferase [Oscillospiraceae bacterium]